MDKFFNPTWWESASVEDLTAELDAGADVMARDEIGETPLHRAAFAFEGLPANIQILLDAGADAIRVSHLSASTCLN